VRKCIALKYSSFYYPDITGVLFSFGKIQEYILKREREREKERKKGRGIAGILKHRRKAMRGHNERWSSAKQGERPHKEPNTASILFLDFKLP
jgi:hypothetical protein